MKIGYLSKINVISKNDNFLSNIINQIIFNPNTTSSVCFLLLFFFFNLGILLNWEIVKILEWAFTQQKSDGSGLTGCWYYLCSKRPRVLEFEKYDPHL